MQAPLLRSSACRAQRLTLTTDMRPFFTASSPLLMKVSACTCKQSPGGGHALYVGLMALCRACSVTQEGLGGECHTKIYFRKHFCSANAPALWGLATSKPSAWVLGGDFKQDSVDKHLIYKQPHRNRFLTTSQLKCSSSFPSHQSKHQPSGSHINSSFSALSSPTFPLLTPAPGPLHLQFPLLQMILPPKISKVHSLTSVRCSLNAGLSADLP